MCRLLGSVSRSPVTVDHVLGDERERFLALAAKHGDGWGHAASTRPGHLDVRKAPDSARSSAAFADVTATRPARASLTHLRWATLGLGVRAENTHPFTDGVVAFAHNGSIDPPHLVDSLVAPDLAATRRGDTDSERYFLAVLSRMREGVDEADALVATVADLVAAPGGSVSLNCMLLTPRALYAVSSHDPDSYDEPDYYPLLHRSTGTSVVVASTGWTDTAGWTTLGNGRMLVVDRETLATTVRPVAAPVTAAVAVAR